MQSVNQAVCQYPSLQPNVFPQHAAACETNSEVLVLLHAPSLLEMPVMAPEKHFSACPHTRDFAGNRAGPLETENSQMFKIHCKRLLHSQEIF